jgi:pimeloyl-ACP methyl ester carboxylesterase
MLHGWGGRPERWLTLVQVFRKAGIRVILPRLPQDKVRHTAGFAAWLLKQTRALPPFYLAGHSFGGQVAIEFCARYPQRVKKLILIASAGIRRRRLKAILLLPWAKRLQFLPSKIKSWCYRLIGETDYASASPVMRATMKLILKDDQRENMKKITRPTLILWGRRDRYTPVGEGRLTHRLIKNSVWAEFDARHDLPFSRPDEVAGKILWFIGLK